MPLYTLINPQIIQPIQNFSGYQYINRIIPILIYVGIVLCVIAFIILLIVGGIEYITSGGDKPRLENGRNKITNAITGLIVLLLLWLILQVANWIFGINIGNLGPPNWGGPRPTSGACNGCWQGSNCMPGNQNNACGSGGGTCVDCSAIDAACDQGYCRSMGPPPVITSTPIPACHNEGDDCGIGWVWECCSGLQCVGAIPPYTPGVCQPIPTSTPTPTPIPGTGAWVTCTQFFGTHTCQEVCTDEGYAGCSSTSGACPLMCSSYTFGGVLQSIANPGQCAGGFACSASTNCSFPSQRVRCCCN
jgi:hypothetical protein